MRQSPDQMKNRLATHLGGVELINPVICGAGEHAISEEGILAALDSGAGAVVAKSASDQVDAVTQLQHAEYSILNEFHEPLRIDRTARHVDRSASLFCRSGLILGSPQWFEKLGAIDRLASEKGQFVVGSIVLSSALSAVRMVEAAQHAGLRILELNIGAPHSAEARQGMITSICDVQAVEDLVSQVRAVFSGALWIKLTGLQGDVSHLAKAAKSGGADAVCVAGRSMGFVPDLQTLEPIIGTSGAYGGRWALPITCRHLVMARRAAGASFPLIGTNGARSGQDVVRMLLSGASAVSLCSLVYLQGYQALKTVIEEIETWLSQRGLAVRGLVGHSADRLVAYEERTEASDQWREFASLEALS